MDGAGNPGTFDQSTSRCPQWTYAAFVHNVDVRLLNVSPPPGMGCTHLMGLGWAFWTYRDLF